MPLDEKMGVQGGNPLAVLCRQHGVAMHRLSNACPLHDGSGGKLLPPETDAQVEKLFNLLLDEAGKERETEASEAALLDPGIVAKVEDALLLDLCHLQHVARVGPKDRPTESLARTDLVEGGVAEGLLTLFVRHTSCSLLIQENADPDVLADLQAFFRRLVPHSDDPSMDWIRHRTEGPDDMPAHIKAALSQTSLSIPVQDGRMMLGIWQGLYLFEHRDRPHRRQVVLHIGD